MVKVGDTLGDFELVREVGRGAMGVVYEARQRSLSRVVAVKVLTPSAAGDPVWVERFRVEAQAAARLSHPGIVPVYAVGETESVPWFAMEFVDGKDLSEIVRVGGPMDPRDAARVVRDAALALDHAHGCGVVHRDVKPGNLMIRADGRVVVMDFGLAKHVGSGSLTATGSLVGTPFYMSPEQAAGDRAGVGPRADVYGLGATFYEMLTGSPPFTGDNAVALLRQITEREPVPPRHLRAECPKDLETIVLACMEKRPDRRYASARELAVDLDRFLADAPISRRRPGVLERSRRFLARNPVAAATAGAAILAIAGGYWLFRGILAGKEEEFATREEQLLHEVDLALEAGRKALEVGKIDDAEAAAERAAASEQATPAQRDLARRILAKAWKDRFDRAREAGDLALLDSALSRPLSRRAPLEWLADALPPVALAVRTDPPEARVELRSLSVADAAAADPAMPLPLGAYRLTVAAPGRATAHVALLLMEPQGKVDLDVRLPRTSDVPPDMAWFGGQVARAPGLGRGTKPSGGPAAVGAALPSVEVDVPPFLLDRSEVTVEAYARFLDAIPHPAERAAMTPRGWDGGRPPADSASLPVTGVTWTQADRYAASVAKRLPTDREMQIAAFEVAMLARAPDALFDPTRFAGKANTLEAGAKGPLPVDRPGAHASRSGVLDLLGNAAEWTASTVPDDPWSVLVVGGSFRERLGPNVVAEFPGDSPPHVGFRCARSYPGGPFARSDLPALARGARRWRVDADGSLVAVRVLDLAAGETGPLGETVLSSPEKGHTSYRVVAARSEGRAVEILAMPDDGPPGTPTHRTRLHVTPPVPRGETASLEVEEARVPAPADVLFLRQGSRFEIEVPADDGAEVALPPDSTVVRLSNPRAHAGVAADGRPVVRIAPSPRERVRVTAVVPAARPADAAAREAHAAAEAAVASVARMDLPPYFAWLAPEFVGARVGSRAEAESNFRDLARRVASIDVAWTLWGADWEGDRVVVRWREEKRLLRPRDGSAPSTIGRVPEITEFWCRRDQATGRWLAVYEDTRSVADEAAGALEDDGKVWRGRAIPGLSVGPPYGSRVRPAPKGLADLAVALDVAAGEVRGEIEAFRRVDPVSRTPALTRADYEGTDFTVVSEGSRPRLGGKVPELTITRVDGGVHSALRRMVLRRGEAAVVVRAVARSPRSREDALAVLEARRRDVDAFFDAVALPSGPPRLPR